MKAGALRMAVVALLAVLFLTGCGPDAPDGPSRDKPLVGVLLYRQNDVYISLVAEALRTTLADRAEVKVLYARQDQLLQNEQIEDLLAAKADALAVNIVDTQSAARAVDAIKKAGLPVVFFNREPDLNSLKSYKLARFVGTTVSDAGIMQGDIVADLWTGHPEYDRNRDGRCQYLMIQAHLDNPEAVARTEHSVKRARERGLEMQQVGQTLLCNWDEDMAYEAVKLILPYELERIECVIANNDAMALGAIKALNEFGYNREGGGPFIPVVGVDAVPQAVEAIKKGIMSGTVVQDGQAMGGAVAGMILNAIDGKDFLDGLPYQWDHSGIAIRIPYARFSAR